MQHRSDKEFQVIFFLLKFPYRIVLDLHLFFFLVHPISCAWLLSLSLCHWPALRAAERNFFCAAIDPLFFVKTIVLFFSSKRKKERKTRGIHSTDWGRGGRFHSVRSGTPLRSRKKLKKNEKKTKKSLILDSHSFGSPSAYFFLKSSIIWWRRGGLRCRIRCGKFGKT